MTELAQARQSSMRHSTGRGGGFRSSSAGKFSMMEGHAMSIPGFAIMPELPPVSAPPQMPLRVPDDHSETMPGDVDRVTAELNIGRAYAREEDDGGREQVFEGIVGRSAARNVLLPAYRSLRVRRKVA